MKQTTGILKYVLNTSPTLEMKFLSKSQGL